MFWTSLSDREIPCSEISHILLLSADHFHAVNAGCLRRDNGWTLHSGLKLWSWRRHAFVECIGADGGDVLLLGVERIAERQLNAALSTGEGEPLGVIGGNQQGDHGRVLGFA